VLFAEKQALDNRVEHLDFAPEQARGDRAPE